MTQDARPRICLFGAGGHGQAVAHQIAQRRPMDIVFADGKHPVGRRIAGFDLCYGDLADIPQGHDILVTIGASAARRSVQERARQRGLTIRHFIADPQNFFASGVGDGAVVMAGAIVNTGAQIGDGVIVNSAAVVEHGCVIGDFAHIAPGAVVAGDAQIGANCWIGANATVLQGIKICDNVTLGAGAVATRDITAAGTYVGLPARIVTPAEGQSTLRGHQ